MAPTSAYNLASVFRERVQECGDKEAIFFTQDPDDHKAVESWTYRRLDREAGAIASSLLRMDLREAQILLVYPSGLHFVAAFLGCMYAGLVAVPAPLPVRSGQQKRRLTAIAKDASVSAVLAHSNDRAVISDWLQTAGLHDISVMFTDTVDPIAQDNPILESDVGSTAMLQYTSGSTGDPKGVILTHENILHNVRTTSRLWRLTSEVRSACWLPLYHDMGLIGGILTPLLNGGSCVILDPVTFVRRPYYWLRAIDRYRAAASAAPNFGYEVCVDRIKDDELRRLDLSSWRIATNGADWLKPSTMREFVDRFSGCGFREDAFCPAYGLAEATLAVTSRRSPTLQVLDADRNSLDNGLFKISTSTEHARQIVSCGTPHDVDVRIVDPVALEHMPDDHVGEIWLRGASVSGGYWGRIDETRRIFGAVTARNEGPYLRTGDLGFIRDGELYITGRIKEVIVVNGQKIAPQDIEHALRSELFELSGATAVCCAHEVGNQRDRIVVICEIKEGSPERLQKLSQAVIHFVAREFGTPVAAVVFVPPGGVQRTTSGKLMRLEMRRRYLAGELSPIYEYVC